MLDSYTSSMCNDSWGRSSFARCLIEVNSEADLVDVVTIGIPSLSEDDFTKETIRVEYEWRPPRCDTCKIFGHVHDYCPKKVASPPIVATSNVVTPNAEKTNDGFQMVGKKKKRKGKSKSTNGGQFTGPWVKYNVRYVPKATTRAPMKGTTYVGYTSQSIPMLKMTGNSSKKDNLSMSNSFSALNEEEEEDEEVENVYDESANLIHNTKASGSSSFMAATDNTSSTNEAVNIANDVSAASSQGQASSTTYADDVMFFSFANLSNSSSSSSCSEFEVHTCSKDCLKSYETLQKYYDQQREALNKSNLEIIGYQMGLESLEARIVVHEKNEAVYEENIAFLKYDVHVENISIKELKNQLENALKEKDDLKLKLENFETSSKNLTKLMNSQISAKDKTGLGYDSHVNESEVLDNVVDSVFDSHESDGDNNQVNDRFKKNVSVYKFKVGETITSKDSLDKTTSETSKDSLEKPKTVRPSALIIEDWKYDSDDDYVTYRQAKNLRKSKDSWVNKRNWNEIMTQKLGNGFEFKKKACFVCGSLNHLIKDYNFYENKMVGKSVLNNEGMATGQREVRPGNLQYTLQDQGIFDSGCSRHMTGNKSYLTDYQDIDGGFIAFAGSPKRGKITGKCKIRTGKLDFEDVYFVKELKFNLFSVSQMCDKKNNVLFIETECLILSPDFKLLDESQEV
ncbi:ribonuclease H-like domain-containing protein [Tanacetum coccineum]